MSVCPGWVFLGVGFFFCCLFSFLHSAFKWTGERRGKGSNYKAGYCDGMLPCLFLGFDGTPSRLHDHSLILPSFLSNSWVFSNSEKSASLSIVVEKVGLSDDTHTSVNKTEGTHFRKPRHA